MLEIYRIIQPYLAALGLTALTTGIILGALYGALKWFGEKWVTSKFTETRGFQTRSAARNRTTQIPDQFFHGSRCEAPSA